MKNQNRILLWSLLIVFISCSITWADNLTIRTTFGMKLKESKNNGLVAIVHFKGVDVDITQSYAAQVTIFKGYTVNTAVIFIQSGIVTPDNPIIVINTPGVEKFILELDLEAEKITGKYKIFNVDEYPLVEYSAEIQLTELSTGTVLQARASVRMAFGNSPPTQPEISIRPLLPLTTEALVLQLDVPSVDVDGDAVYYVYRWRNNGVLHGSEVSSVFPASKTQKGDLLECTLTPSDGTDDGPSASASVTIQNSPPTQPTLCQISPNPPADADDLLANFGGSTDADFDSIGYKLRWKKDDVAQPAYDDQAAIPAAVTSLSEVWHLTIIPTDGSDDGTSCSDSVTILN